MTILFQESQLSPYFTNEISSFTALATWKWNE